MPHSVLETYGAVAEEERERRPEKRGKGKVRMFFKKQLFLHSYRI